MDAGRLLEPDRFKGDIDGKRAGLYVLRNAGGMVACITSYGAKIEQLLVPDIDGLPVDVVLGYGSLEAATNGSASMGAFIGRYAGRIGNASFELGGKTWRLGANNGPHCLHGGVKGSRSRVFDAVQVDASSVEMRYLFEDGEEGFPGTLALRLLYSLTDANELVIDHEAMSLDVPTVASFTSHPFFNLDGEASGSVMNHELVVQGDNYFELDAGMVATGRLLPVCGTRFDFRKSAAMGSRGQGYDDCYLVEGAPVGGVTLAARVVAPSKRMAMEVWSTEPAMQFYTGLTAGEPLPGGPGKYGRRYVQQQGFCLEPQWFPNAPNCPEFPSAVHEPGQSRAGKTIYRFVKP